jgi:hypothetical protein
VPLRPVSELGLVDITDVPARDGTQTSTRRHSAGSRRTPSRAPRSDSSNQHRGERRGDRPEDGGASTRTRPHAGRRASKNLAGPDQTSARATSPSASPATGHRPSRTRAASTSKLAGIPPAPTKDADAKSKRARSRTSRKLGTTSERGTARTPRSTARTRTDQIKRANGQAHLITKPRGMNESTAMSSKRSRSRSGTATDNGSGDSTRSATTHAPKRSKSSGSATPRGPTARRRSSAGSGTKGNSASRQTPRSRNGRVRDQTKPSSAVKIGISALMGASLVASGLLLARVALRR